MQIIAAKDSEDTILELKIPMFLPESPWARRCILVRCESAVLGLTLCSDLAAPTNQTVPATCVWASTVSIRSFTVKALSTKRSARGVSFVTLPVENGCCFAQGHFIQPQEGRTKPAFLKIAMLLGVRGAHSWRQQSLCPNNCNCSFFFWGKG